MERYDLAIEAFSEVARLNPRDAFNYIELGSSYEIVGDNELAIENYRKGLDLEPDFGQGFRAEVEERIRRLRDNNGANET